MALEQLKALHGLNLRFSGVTVMTYDQLLAQGERLVEMLGSQAKDQDETPLDELPSLEEDDIPF